jgi:hypothetical protein
MTKKADAEAPGKPAGEAGSKPGRKKGGQLTHGAIVAQTVAQGGKCWVTGDALSGDVAMVGGKLVTGAVGELARGGDLQTLRAKLTDRLAGAKKTVETYGKLLDEKGAVTSLVSARPSLASTRCRQASDPRGGRGSLRSPLRFFDRSCGGPGG